MSWPFLFLGATSLFVLIQTILGMSQTWPATRDKGKWCSIWPVGSAAYNNRCISRFCEEIYSFEDSPLLCQKANGLSSYAFFIPVVYVSLRISAPAFTVRFVTDVLFITSNTFNTFGNLAYHGFCYDSGYWDRNGFMLVAACITTMSWYRLVRKYIDNWSPLAAITVFFATMMLLASLGADWGFRLFKNSDVGERDTLITFGVLILFPNLCVAAQLSYGGVRDFWNVNHNGLLAVAFALTGVLVWVLEGHYGVCWQRSWFQLHAVWHLFMSLATLLAYMHIVRKTTSVRKLTTKLSDSRLLIPALHRTAI